MLKPSLGNFEYYFASMWHDCNYVVVWAFFGIPFIWDWNENWQSFSSPVVTAAFSKFAEDIKKRWQEYTEELYKKDLHDQDNHDGVITHLEPDILECEV